MPTLPALIERVSTATNSNKLAEAESILLEAQGQEPEYLCLHAQALIAAARGQLQEALDLLVKSSQLKPDYTDALLASASICVAANQLQDAVRCFERAIGRNDQDARAYVGLAEVLLRVGDRERGLEFMKHAYTLDPELEGLRSRLAKVAFDAGHFALAEEALEGQPGIYQGAGEATLMLAQVKLRMNKPVDSLSLIEMVRDDRFCERAIRIRANALVMLDRYEDAEQLIMGAMPSINYETAALQTLLGTIHVFTGREEGAVEWFRLALVTDPDFVEAWNGLTYIDAESVTDDEVAGLQARFELWKKSDIHKAIVAAYALASIYEARREYAQQLHWLDRGSELKRKVAPVQRATFETSVEDIQRYYCGPYPACSDNEPAGNQEGQRPVFILGMPRSGTTLMEQIISSHSMVSPMGESLAFAEAMDALEEKWGTFSIFEVLNSRKEEFTAAIREGMLAFYNQQAEVQGITGCVYTDKGINHYLNVGLLRHIFPDARFIAMHRDPVDVSFGAYKQHFSHGQNFSYGYESLAYTLSAYRKLIDFWQGQLGDDLLQVYYEELVVDASNLIPKVIRHANLPWEEACMAFQDNQRAVRTASTRQVRRGMDASFLQKWRRYGELLGPLLEALAREGVDPESYRYELQQRGVLQ